MPKPNLVQNVEAIADRISKKNIRECRSIVQLGTWVKNLADENRVLKQRIEELEIRVKKLNTYGATPLSKAEQSEDQTISGDRQTRITAGQLKRFRMSRQLSQAALGALLGVNSKKYARWEAGKSVMISAVEDKFREIQNLKGTQLRSKLQELGYFQATGKQTKFLKGQEDTPATPRNPVAPGIISNIQIRELRLKMGLSQPQMAEIFGVKGKTLANWEYAYCRPPEAIAKKTAGNV